MRTLLSIAPAAFALAVFYILAGIVGRLVEVVPV